MKQKRITYFMSPVLCLLSVCITAHARAIALNYQDDLSARVEKMADALLGIDSRPARAEFRAMGDAAIPEILKLIQYDEKQLPHQIAVRNSWLVAVIAEYAGPRAEAALIALLSHHRPHIRGYAARHLGIRKSRLALPSLINLLDDTNVFLYDTSAPHVRSYDMLVRDAAVEALQKITGKGLAKSESRDKQVEAWKRWWQKRQKKISRSSHLKLHAV